MQWIKQDNHYMVALKRGEKIMNSLKLFIATENIKGGAWWGLGAVDEAELAVYDVAAQQYHRRTVTGAMEVTNVSGTIGMYKSEPVVHGHITVTDENFMASGGHLVEARVSGVMELHVEVWPELTKVIDEQTGLKVFLFKDALN